METNVVCLICHDEQEPGSCPELRCCGKSVCVPCASRLTNERIQEGCPACRSTCGRVWAILDGLSFDTVTINCDGNRETLEITERTRRRFLRNVSKNNAGRDIDIDIDTLTGFDAYWKARARVVRDEARECLIPLLNAARPGERFNFCFKPNEADDELRRSIIDFMIENNRDD